MSIGDHFFKLFTVYCSVKKYLFYEQIKILKYYFSFPRLFFLDILFFLFYFLQNPYRISRKFYQSKNKVIEPYGETPFSTIWKIIKKSEITGHDHIIEMGSGRSKSSFWLHILTGCSVDAYEWIDPFVTKALYIKKILKTFAVHILQKDFLKADLDKATFVYLYGTCMNEEQIKKVCDTLQQLHDQSRILTISFPLSDYVKTGINIEKTFSVSFPWGTTDAYLHRKTSALVLKD